MPEGSRRNLISRLRAGDMLRAVWCYNPIDLNNFKRGVHDPVSGWDVARPGVHHATVRQPRPAQRLPADAGGELPVGC